MSSMALPVIPLIGAGASILGQGLSNASTAGQNRKSQRFAREMYERQRADALADWNAQNEYNSPKAQMARLRDANLNENLVYGNGSATTTAGVPRGSSPPSADFRPSNYNFGESLSLYNDLTMREAQTDNLEAQNTVLLQEALLKAAQTAGVNASTAKTNLDTDAGKFALGQATRLADTSAQMAEAQLRKTVVDTDIALAANERAIAQNSSSLATAAEAILKSRSDRATAVGQRRLIDAQIEDIKRNPQLKDLDVQLRKFGLTSSDPFWMRLLARVLEDPASIPRKMKELGNQILERGGKAGKALHLDKLFIK